MRKTIPVYVKYGKPSKLASLNSLVSLDVVGALLSLLLLSKAWLCNTF